MPNPLFTFFSYFQYRFRAKSAHGLHSPFVFRLYNEVINSRTSELKSEIDTIRSRYFRDKTLLKYVDPKTEKSHSKTVGAISRKSASSAKFQQFLVQLINHLEMKSVLEAGTSVGLCSEVMSLSGAKSITTIEGSKVIAAYASHKLKDLPVEVVNGNIHEVFEQVLARSKPDLIFLDADHRKAAIEFYMSKIFDPATPPVCMVIHDIYWSRGMSEAWKAICQDPSVKLTIDLFEAGLVFPDFPMEKQHFTLRF